MAIKRPKPEEIVVKSSQVEVLIEQGMPRIDAIRQNSVTEQTGPVAVLFRSFENKFCAMVWLALMKTSPNPPQENSL